MIRTFCDHCDVEIDDKNCVPHSGLLSETKKPNQPTLYVRVILGNANDPSDFDFCKYCVIDCISTLDDRPKSETCG